MILLWLCLPALAAFLPVLIADGREAVRRAGRDADRLADPTPLPGEPGGSDD